MPLTPPQLALLYVDLCLYGTLWRCLLAGVAFSEPPVGALTGYIVIPELPGVVDGTSAPLRPACDFPWLRRSRPAPSTAVVLRYPARSLRCAPRDSPPGWWALSHRSRGAS